MLNQPWGGLLILTMGLAGCGLEVSAHPPMPRGAAPADGTTRHVLRAPEPEIEARIKAIIESGLRVTDYYPRVLSLKVHTITPGVSYGFDANTRISTLGGPIPGRFIGTYHAPSRSLTYSRGVPDFAIGKAYTGETPFEDKQEDGAR
jgi:hypothetical protein